MYTHMCIFRIYLPKCQPQAHTRPFSLLAQCDCSLQKFVRTLDHIFRLLADEVHPPRHILFLKSGVRHPPTDPWSTLTLVRFPTTFGLVPYHSGAAPLPQP